MAFDFVHATCPKEQLKDFENCLQQANSFASHINSMLHNKDDEAAFIYSKIAEYDYFEYFTASASLQDVMNVLQDCDENWFEKPFTEAVPTIKNSHIYHSTRKLVEAANSYKKSYEALGPIQQAALFYETKKSVPEMLARLKGQHWLAAFSVQPSFSL